MKNLYHKNKGKVYPSPSPSPSPSAAVTVNPSSNRDDFSVLNLLPTAIIALVTILSLQDREVLAYLITRSMKTTNPFSIDEEKKKYCKKTNFTHKPPIFDCGCFDCYTSYWFRWDSSPNRELIHQVIEAFEEHLTNGEISKKKNGKGGKNKKDCRMGRRGNEKSLINEDDNQKVNQFFSNSSNSSSSSFVSVLVLPSDEPVLEMEKADDFPVGGSEFESEEMGSEEICQQMKQKQVNEVSGELIQMDEEEEEEAVKIPASLNKGLVRKVLPDVMGLFNSRLWSLWNPTV